MLAEAPDFSHLSHIYSITGSISTYIIHVLYNGCSQTYQTNDSKAYTTDRQRPWYMADQTSVWTAGVRITLTQTNPDHGLTYT